MLERIFYLTISYLTVFVVVITAIHRAKLADVSSRPEAVKRTGVVILLLLTMPLWPYGIVEAQTALLGKRLEPAVLNVVDEMGLGPIRQIKVLSARPGRYVVYVVEPCARPWDRDCRSILIELRKSNSEWTYHDMGCPWSERGSADGMIFPPYPRPSECK